MSNVALHPAPARKEISAKHRGTRSHRRRRNNAPHTLQTQVSSFSAAVDRTTAPEGRARPVSIMNRSCAP